MALAFLPILPYCERPHQPVTKALLPGETNIMIRKSIALVALLFTAVFLFGFASASQADDLEISDLSAFNQNIYAITWAAAPNGSLAFQGNVRVSYDIFEAPEDAILSASFGFSGTGWTTAYGGVTNLSTTGSFKSGFTTTITGGLTFVPTGGTAVHATATYVATTRLSTTSKPAESLKIVADNGAVLYTSNGLLGLSKGSVYITLF
jgi:hypothetical protein